MIIVYETTDGIELDVLTVNGTEVTYKTGKGQGVVDQATRRNGSLKAALDELAGGWSNGYVVTKRRV